MRRRAKSPLTDDSAITLGDTNSLDLLVHFGYLEADAVAQLRSLGIATCTQLVFEVRRNAKTLQWQLGLDEEELLLAAAAARFLNLSGPGSLCARQVVIERVVKDMALDELENLHIIVEEDQQQVVAGLARVLRFMMEVVEPINWRKQRRTLGLSFVGVLAVMLSHLMVNWNGIFRGTAGDPFHFALNTLSRANALDGALSLFAGMSAVMLIMWLVPLLVNKVFARVIDWLDRRTLSLADYPIIQDAGSTLSSRQHNRNRLLLQNFFGIYLGLIIGLAALNYFVPLDGLETTFGFVAAMVIAGGLTALFMRQKHAFQRLADYAGWGEMTDKRYARSLLGRFGVICLFTIPVMFAGVFLLVQLTTQTATTWTEQRYAANLAAYERAINSFTPAAEEAAVWEKYRPEWLEAGRGGTQELVTELNKLRDVVDRAFPGLFQAVVSGMWACGLLFVFVEFRYADRKKGVVAAVVWVALAVLSDRLPGPLAHAVFGLSEGTVQAAIMVVAVAALLSILSEVWVGGERPGTRYCENPGCAVRYEPKYGNDDVVCSKCGRPLGEGVGVNGDVVAL